MNDIEELKRFVVVHANAQKIPRAKYGAVLARIVSDEEGAAGSWAVEWSRTAAELEQAGRYLDAYRYYNMARFPFVDGPTRQRALEKCVGAFERVAAGAPHIRRVEVDVLGSRMRCWTTGLTEAGASGAAGVAKPLLLLMGGIVSIKEQWAPILAQVRANGMAGLVAEMPGVGENPLRYEASSWRLLSGLIDAVSDRADTAHTYALALSFSGHLALRCAVEDRRIRGVITSGAPVRRFFTDTAWQPRVPKVTVDTVAHLTGVPSDRVFDHISGWALSDAELSALDVPVGYLVSRRDEIVPPGEVDVLRAHLDDLRVNENDDVHGSPRHTTESGLWALSTVLTMNHAHGVKPAVIGAALRVLRARHRLRVRA